MLLPDIHGAKLRTGDLLCIHLDAMSALFEQQQGYQRYEPKDPITWLTVEPVGLGVDPNAMCVGLSPCTSYGTHNELIQARPGPRSDYPAQPAGPVSHHSSSPETGTR